MSLAYISHQSCLLHDVGEDHPESPARLQAIWQQLQNSDIASSLQYYDAPPIDRELLYQIHDPSYVDTIFEQAPSEGILQLDPDTAMTPYSLDAALHAAGAVVYGVDLVMERKHGAVFCGVRPPGHHAERDHAMGFCIFNNIAAGVRYALDHWKLERVAIVDFDVHHGNGSEAILLDEPRALLCSTFQHPYYPYKGADTRNDHIINLPLRAGSTGRDFRFAVESWLLPGLDIFRPQLIFISAGFDAHRDDPLASLLLDEEDYGWITQQVRAVADQHAEGRIVSSLEGGYNLEALAKSVEAHLRALIQ